MIGSYVVDSLASDRQTRTAGDDAWRIVSELLRSSFRWQIVVGFLFVAAAWLAGPRRVAIVCRQALAPFLRRRAYPYVALAVVALVLLVTGPATDFARILYVLVTLGLLVAGIEILRRQALLEFPEGGMPFSLGAARTRVTSWLETRRTARPAVPGSSRAAGSLTVQLKELADLHERGALTDEEYAAAKARVLTGG
jgi:hypothetical protein